VNATTPAPAAWPPDVMQRIGAGAFLLIDKPRGPSSHQVTAWVRDILGVDRTGHAGTLDPHVSGLLWVGVGAALKLIPLVLEFPKRYVAAIVLHGKVSRPELEKTLEEFRGPVYQTPPVRSAVKRERRVRVIHRLELLEFEFPNLLVDLVADSGTYVRTLAVDLGDALGVGAHMVELRRVGTGPFTESMAVSLSRLQDAADSARSGASGDLVAILRPLDAVWHEFPRAVVKDAAASAVAHGAGLARGGIVSVPRPFAKGATVVVVSRSSELVAFGTALVDSDALRGSKPGWVIATKRVLVEPTKFPPRWGHPTGETAIPRTTHA
jgi:tRNA pseudouridine55 synthase